MTIVACENIQPVSNQIPNRVMMITQGFGAGVEDISRCEIIGAAELWRLEGGVEAREEWVDVDRRDVGVEENQLLDVDHGGRRGRNRERN